jgi:mono/diheme cytochrome c family protein
MKHIFGWGVLFWGALLFSSVASAQTTTQATKVESSAVQVDFVRQVRPLFQRHCYACHAAEKQKGGLRLDIKSAAFKGGDTWGASIVPGDVSASPLMELITSHDDDLRMPMDAARLTESEIQIVRQWIEQGAVWPASADLAKLEDWRDHWSFKPLRPVSAATSIDRFIQMHLAAQGLEMNPPADSRTLVRRIYFNLTGLPPSPEAVEQFVQQPDVELLVERLLASPRYGERWAQHWLDVIRWAETVGFETNAERRDAWPYRDWLIAALNQDKPYDQFLFEQIAGDTVSEDAALGFLVAGPANLPGQVGRDEAAMRGARQDELDEVISTVSQACLGLTVGCARCHDHKFDPISQRDYYAMQAIFAGLNYGSRRWRGPENDSWTAEVSAAGRAVADLRRELELIAQEHSLRPALNDIHSESFEALTATAVRMRIEATADASPASLYEFEVWTKAEALSPSVNVALASVGAVPSASSFALANQSRHFDNLIDGSVDQRQAYPWVAAEKGPAWFRIDFSGPAQIERFSLQRGSSMPVDFVVEALTSDSQQWREVAHTRDRLPRVDDRRRLEDIKIESLPAEKLPGLVKLLGEIRSAESRLNRLQAGPQVYAASFAPERPVTFVLHRGDAMQRRAEVEPAVPEFLGQVITNSKHNEIATQSERDDRVALARHLTHPDHPLTARVIVNRVWHHHFGMGLVATPSDFGRMGAAPSHPELLDWLARKFMAEGWSLKQLHRWIVTSRTYCQSSIPRAEAVAVDADGRWLWRFSPRRLEAEALRDSILSVSGNLNLAMGGPGFDFFNQRGGLADYVPKETFEAAGWRRMVYAHKVRMIAVDIFGSFDCPDAGQMQPSRTRSITPLQALGMLNSPFMQQQAQIFAARVRREAGDKLESQLDRASRLALSRPLTPVEQQQLMKLAAAHGLEQVCRALFNTSEFAFIP